MSRLIILQLMLFYEVHWYNPIFRLVQCYSAISCYYKEQITYHVLKNRAQNLKMQLTPPCDLYPGTKLLGKMYLPH